MIATIAFFPWLKAKETLQIGNVRLIPYVHRKAPGDQPSISQSDIDGVLRPYSRKPSTRDNRATILEVGRWRTGMHASPRVISRLFHVRDLVAFTALSKRRLFTHFDYTNSHAYTLIVQRFKPGDVGTFSFTTRRRDGGTTQIWGSDEFAFHLPNHVRADTALELDIELLRTLSRLPKSMSHVFEAIREFNAANTDDLNVPEHVEMVMMKSAFEWLLGINENAKEFQRALAESLRNLQSRQRVRGPMARRWAKRLPGARPIEAWARDFCAVRGMSAHGRQWAGRGASVFPAVAHLAFAALLFPLLLKKTLADAGRFQMDDWDLERLRLIDQYLMHNPFAKRARREKHPWIEVENEALLAARAASFYSIMTKALEATRTKKRAGGKPSPQ